MTHELKGPHFNYVYGEGGKMFVRHCCDCGCVDKRWEIQEQDTIVAENRVLLFGKLKNLLIVSNRFILGTKKTPAELTYCKTLTVSSYQLTNKTD